ncbi:hypothetical protein ACLOJK_027107 [Asimina triloba]
MTSTRWRARIQRDRSPSSSDLAAQIRRPHPLQLRLTPMTTASSPTPFEHDDNQRRPFDRPLPSDFSRRRASDHHPSIGRQFEAKSSDNRETRGLKPDPTGRSHQEGVPIFSIWPAVQGSRSAHPQPCPKSQIQGKKMAADQALNLGRKQSSNTNGHNSI